MTVNGEEGNRGEKEDIHLAPEIKLWEVNGGKWRESIYSFSQHFCFLPIRTVTNKKKYLFFPFRSNSETYPKKNSTESQARFLITAEPWPRQIPLKGLSQSCCIIDSQAGPLLTDHNSRHTGCQSTHPFQIRCTSQNPIQNTYQTLKKVKEE